MTFALSESFDPVSFKADLLREKDYVCANLRHSDAENAQLDWFKRMANRFVWAGRLLGLGAASFTGYVPAWATVCLVLVGAALNGIGNTVRFGIVWHHSAHGGYESVKGHERSTFAMGGLLPRLRDWNDWILPVAWQYEHNKLHHYKLNELRGDPDYYPRNYGAVIDAPWPKAVKVLFPLFYMLTWKWQYFAVNTLYHWARSQRKVAAGNDYEQRLFPQVVYNALVHGDWRFALNMALVLAPYTLTHLVAPVAAAWWFGAPAATLWTLGFYVALADVAANIHSFLVIVTSHVGEDLYCFSTPCKAGSAEFYARQILGSVSCPGNSDWSDFFHAGQSYHVEHHLFPDLSMLCYRHLKPLVQRVCAKHGVPYVQESVWVRMPKLYRVTVGEARQRECATAIPPLSTRS